MKVRQPESPTPVGESCAAGYFAPPPAAIGGAEWRLTPALRLAAQSKNASTILTEAVVAQCKQHLTPSPGNLPMALADLAVTGRVAFADFCAKRPQDGPIQAAALASLTASGIAGVTPQLVQTSVSEVLDRAYQVAWFLRAQTPRGNLGWIAVSGEDDLPHRPVNVPRTKFPQCDLVFTVGAIAVQTRYAIATATDPVIPQVSLPQRTIPPVFEPVLPPNDRLILYIHGSDSRLEEADDLIPRLVRTPDGRPSGFTVISIDLPGSGYVNLIDHTEVAPWSAVVLPASWPLPPMGGGTFTISLLPFLEQFVLNFVSALSSQLGQPGRPGKLGLVEQRLAAVIGGSLGGNLALRLAKRGGWLRNAIAYSPGSVWHAMSALDAGDIGSTLALKAGIAFCIPSVGLPEDPLSRETFFASSFDQKIPFRTQPEQWYRDGWPCKMEYINKARLDRRETYTPQSRRWHWRISFEELVFSWRDAPNQAFRSRVLLGAGSYDDIAPANIFTNTRKLAAQLAGTNGDTFFFQDTGHSIHAERPAALARKVAAFLTRVGDGHKADDYDGDGKSDFAFWRPTDGTWHILQSSSGTEIVQQLGMAGDIPVPGDYDGDGKTDFAVWRPSEGNWYVINSSTGAQTVHQWGLPTDIPVPGDYDGDGKTDLAVWRPSEGNWYILESSTRTPRVQQLGSVGDVPVPGDYDGDGKTDLAVWRPTNGNWYVMESCTGAQTVQQWGRVDDIPVPGDYNGAEYGVWRPTEGNWYLMDCFTGAQTVQQWGQVGDIPMTGDFDGDGKTDFVVWRPNEGNWYVIDSSTKTSRPPVKWGQLGDIPLPWRPAVDGAEFSSQTLPLSIVAGAKKQGKIVMSNTGTSVWEPGRHFFVSTPRSQITIQAGVVTSPVSPRQQCVFTFDIPGGASGTKATLICRMFSAGQEFGAESEAATIVFVSANEPTQCEAIRKKLVAIQAQIASLEERLNPAGNPVGQANIRRAILDAERELSSERGRGSQLQCTLP